MAQDWDAPGKGGLPSHIVRRAYVLQRTLLQHPDPKRYPGVRKLKNVPGVYVVNVTLAYRLMFEPIGDTLVLLGVADRKDCYTNRSPIYRAKKRD